MKKDIKLNLNILKLFKFSEYNKSKVTINHSLTKTENTMYDFNNITVEQEILAVAKFKDYGKGIVMGKFVSNLADENSAKWSDLVNPTSYSVTAIKNKMIEIAHRINTTVNDTLLGDMTVAFTVRDHKGKEVKFTYIEMYTFLRAILKFRKDTEEYKAKSKKLAEAKAYLEANKSSDDRMKEASELVSKLTAELE